MPTVWYIDPAHAGSDGASATGGELQSFGVEKISKTVPAIWSSVATDDIIAFKRGVWHSSDNGGKFFDPGSNYISKNGLWIRAYGSGADNYARLDSGTYLNDGTTTTVNDGSKWNLLTSTDTLAWAAAGSAAATGTWWRSWLPRGSAPVRRLCRDSTSSGSGESQRSVGAGLRIYERKIEVVANGRPNNLSNIGVENSVWWSCRWPVVNLKKTDAQFSSEASAGTLQSGKYYWLSTSKTFVRATSTTAYVSVDLFNMPYASYEDSGWVSVTGQTGADETKNTRVYLFVWTGLNNTSPDSHYSGLYCTQPYADSYGVILQATSANITRGLVEDLLIRGTNEIGFGIVTSTASVKGVDFNRVKLDLCAQRGVLWKTGFGEIENCNAYDCIVDGRWNNQVESYLSDENGAVSHTNWEMWSTISGGGKISNVTWQRIKALNGLWHGGLSLEFVKKGSKNFKVLDFEILGASNLRDGRAFSIGDVDGCVIRNGVISGHVQKGHMGGANVLIENVIFKNSGGWQGFNTNESRSAWNFGRAGTKDMYDSNDPLLWTNFVIRHCVFDDRGAANRYATFEFTTLPYSKLPENGVSFYNNVVLPSNQNGSLGNFLWIQAGSVGPAAGNYRKQNFRNNLIGTDTGTWTTATKILYTSQSAGTASYNLNGGTTTIPANAQNNQVTVTALNLDAATYQPETSSSVVLGDGVAQVGDPWSEYNKDKLGNIRSATTPSIGSYEIYEGEAPPPPPPSPPITNTKPWGTRGRLLTPVAPVAPTTAPSIIIVDVTSSEISLTLTDVEGATIYEVETSSDNGVTWTLTTDLGTSVTLSGLNSATAYLIRARAANQIGTGPWSETEPVTTL